MSNFLDFGEAAALMAGNSTVSDLEQSVTFMQKVMFALIMCDIVLFVALALACMYHCRKCPDLPHFRRDPSKELPQPEEGSCG